MRPEERVLEWPMLCRTFGWKEFEELGEDQVRERTAAGILGVPDKARLARQWLELRSTGHPHLTNNTCTSDLLPKVAGIIIVDLPAWFDHEQEKSNASPGYR